MIKLLKYLKPYALFIIVTIGLLFVMANADLALPDYLSRIVNVGIQQNGIDSVIPQYIRQSQLDNVALFFDDQEAATVYDAYQLVDENSADYSELVQTVPALETEPVYVLKDLTNDELAQIEPAMSRGLLVLYVIEQIQNNPDQAAEMLGDLPFDPSQIPAGMDLFTVLRMAPDRLEEIKQQITVQFESING